MPTSTSSWLSPITSASSRQAALPGSRILLRTKPMLGRKMKGLDSFYLWFRKLFEKKSPNLGNADRTLQYSKLEQGEGVHFWIPYHVCAAAQYSKLVVVTLTPHVLILLPKTLALESLKNIYIIKRPDIFYINLLNVFSKLCVILTSTFGAGL